MVLGPMIDPPYPQSNYRPCGVYHYPDTRVGCAGRTIYELWGTDGQCISCASVADSARLVLEPRLWEFLDLMTDGAKAVGNGPRMTPSVLRVLR